MSSITYSWIQYFLELNHDFNFVLFFYLVKGAVGKIEFLGSSPSAVPQLCLQSPSPHLYLCIHVYNVYLYVWVQWEDAAASVRSRNAEPPSPESLRRREEALYADSGYVCFCVYLQYMSLCACVHACKVHY